MVSLTNSTAQAPSMLPFVLCPVSFLPDHMFPFTKLKLAHSCHVYSRSHTFPVLMHNYTPCAIVWRTMLFTPIFHSCCTGKKTLQCRWPIMVLVKLPIRWHNIKNSTSLIAGLPYLLSGEKKHSSDSITSFGWNLEPEICGKSKKLQAAWCAHHGQALLDPPHLSQERPPVS